MRTLPCEMCGEEIPVAMLPIHRCNPNKGLDMTDLHPAPLYPPNCQQGFDEWLGMRGPTFRDKLSGTELANMRAAWGEGARFALSDKAAPQVTSETNLGHSPRIVCHAPGDRCLGCDHYHGRAPVCAYADKDAPEYVRGLENAAKVCDARFAFIRDDHSGDNEYFYLDELENAAKAIRALAAQSAAQNAPTHSTAGEVAAPTPAPSEPGNAGLATSRSASSGAPDGVVVPGVWVPQGIRAARLDCIQMAEGGAWSVPTAMIKFIDAMLAAAPAAQPNAELAGYLRALAEDLDAEDLRVSAEKCRQAADALSHERSSEGSSSVSMQPWEPT